MIKLGNPYREMATTCMTRPITEKKIVWKRFESELFEKERFQAKVLSGRFINSAASVFRKAYPEVYGSPHEFVLMPGRDTRNALLSTKAGRTIAGRKCIACRWWWNLQPKGWSQQLCSRR